MKKINSSGFVLAETLVVTVFLMVIFSMIYASFLPLIGEYEKRENYDTVDGKYGVYWIKRMIEDASYDIPDSKKDYIRNKGYVRFECSDVNEDEEKREFCINIVRNLQVASCDKKGNNCEIYITRYRLDDSSDDSRTWFKQAVRNNVKKYQEFCSGDGCKESYISACIAETTDNEENRKKCSEESEKKVFRSGFQDYIFNLPDYTAESLNYANYRVIACFHNKKDNNNYYSYATIEVSR